MFPAGTFEQNINSNWSSALYSDSVEIKFNLTDYEIELINQNGFAVTERLSANSFGQHFLDIYHSDLPVFVSTDAILHTVHMSYDRILLETEVGFLYDKLIEMLELMHSQISTLENTYASHPEILERLKDVDVYLSVPRKLLNENSQLHYQSNAAITDVLLSLIFEEEFKEIQFFSTSTRKIDFSQFKPRGHYSDDPEFPFLEDYWRAMIWLGRMELYLIAPVANEPTYQADVKRQTIMSTLINELMELADAHEIHDDIEATLEFFVGEQDNVTPDDLDYVFDAISINSASQLLDSANFTLFQDSLAVQSFAFQRILSQMLESPMTPDSIVPASAYMLFGQRFIIDSYVTGSVVFDRINYQGEKVRRMLPSTLDILFALGNDAAGQLLIPELDQYHYSQNLAALRYIIDRYGNDFWNSTIYNMWLNSIRTLNPPADRSLLPSFMQTAAWWQQKMNTQLASWTQLRHDNLLYAKQSYTGIPICYFPFGYVEPIPEFYLELKKYAAKARYEFTQLPFTFPMFQENVIRYYDHLYSTCDTLGSIAQKELDGVEFSNDEKLFLERLVYEAGGGCHGPNYDGWYAKLFYGNGELGYPLIDKNYIVADYHTAPADASGGIVGWVAHAGTGNINLAILSADLPDGQHVAFVGPVNSYHEYTSTNFLRLTDEEWESNYLNLSLRPDWVNLYLADADGASLGSGATLLTDVNENNSDQIIPETHIVAQNYPNPFNATTIINFKIPLSLTNSLTEITIYDINGEKVKTLLKQTLPSGNYLTRWDGTNNYNSSAASGVYFYHISVGAQKFVGKMSLLK